MSGLTKIQTDFQGYVLEGGDDALQHVVSSGRGSAKQRLDVYYQAYRLRLLEVIGSNYPGLKGMLGEEQFTSVGYAYIDKYPSTQPSIRWFGSDLEDFLTETCADHPHWAEMARFDQVRDMAFDATDTTTVTVEQLSGLAAKAWPELCFEFHPSVQKPLFHWNVCDIWRAVKEDKAMPGAELLTECTSVVVWRQDLTVCWRSMPDDETATLGAAMNQQSFSDLCAGLCDWHDESEVPARGAGILKQWVTDGLISRLVL